MNAPSAAPPSGHSNKGRVSARRKAILAGVALTGLASSLFVSPGVASAATMPPEFPDNIVVFPNRDMVVLEGGFGGDQPVLVQVHRGDQLMGAVAGQTVTGGEWEVNHPGGPCWGDNTAMPSAGSLPQVTPDILPGDVISVRNEAGQLLANSIVQEGEVAQLHYTDGATAFTVTGTLDPAIDPANTEQRIVNPDLTETAIQRRDLRAVQSDTMEPGPRGGYTSRLQVNADGSFTAYYDFADSGDQAVDVARMAATGGGERFMAWELTDAAGNRQSLTIAEKGEVGGPGMGGCPSGPSGAVPTAGQFGAVWNADGTSVQVNWTPATAQPGAPAVVGYSVEAIAKTATEGTGTFHVEGERTGASAKQATIAGLSGGAAAYTIEVRPLMDGGSLGAAFGPATGDGGAPSNPDEPNSTPPTADPAPTADGVTEASSVTLVANGNVEMYYTTDNTSPVASGGFVSDTAVLYTGPIPITAETTLQWFGYNSSGVASDVGTGTYAPPTVVAAAPAAPGVLRATPGNGSVSLTWQAGADNGSPISGYTVTTLDSAGTQVGTDQNVTVTNATVSGLTNGTEYTFQVTATNGVGTSPAAEIKARPGDTVTITAVRYRQNKELRISGVGSSTTSTYTLYHGPVGDVTGSTRLGSPTVTAAVAPATGVEWELRLRNGQANLPTSRGNVIWVQSSGGGVGSFTFR